MGLPVGCGDSLDLSKNQLTPSTTDPNLHQALKRSERGNKTVPVLLKRGRQERRFERPICFCLTESCLIRVLRLEGELSFQNAHSM